MARGRLGEELPLSVHFQSRQVFQERPQWPFPTVSSPPRDRDYELTVPFGILTEYGQQVSGTNILIKPIPGISISR